MRRARVLGLWLAVWGAASVVGAGGALADGGAAVVLPLQLGTGISAGRTALESAVERGLLAAGWTVPLGAADVAKRLAAQGVSPACAEGPCLGEAGRAAGAPHLVVGQVAKANGLFVARFRLVRAVDRAEVASHEGRCDADDCSVAELCRTTVRDLAAKAGARIAAGEPRASGEGQGAAAAAGGAPANGPGTGPATPSTEAASTPPRPAWRTYAPVAAIVAGAASLGVATVMLVKHRDCVEKDDCIHRYDYKPDAWIWAGAGVALAGAGIAWLVLDARAASRPAVSVGIGPGHLAVRGRF